jgi:hypothetical protein
LSLFMTNLASFGNEVSKMEMRNEK